ncbi:unnamed protein product, partial [Mesorhabditis spiculigera]
MMRNIDGFLGAELKKLASQIGEAITSEISELRVSDFHFLYFNPSSLSLRTSFNQSPLIGMSSLGLNPSASQLLPPVPQQVYRIVCETYDRLLDSSEDFGECIVKDSADWWIVIKKVNDRILIILLPPSANLPTLQDAYMRVSEIIKSRFQGIFLL